MTTNEKEFAAPPSYEEAMHYSTQAPPSVVPTAPPQVGIIYPYAAVNSNVPTAPTYVMPPGGTTYGSFESAPVTVELPPPPVTNLPSEIIVIGGCPACRIGYLEDGFSCLGVFCAIVFFPIGILCCLALKNKRCTNCGTEF